MYKKKIYGFKFFICWLRFTMMDFPCYLKNVTQKEEIDILINVSVEMIDWLFYSLEYEGFKKCVNPWMIFSIHLKY